MFWSWKNLQFRNKYHFLILHLSGSALSLIREYNYWISIYTWNRKYFMQCIWIFFLYLSHRRTVAPVKDLLCLEIRGRKLTFVLYEDGLLQLWDLLRCTRFFDNMLEGKFSGTFFFLSYVFSNLKVAILTIMIISIPTNKWI